MVLEVNSQCALYCTFDEADIRRCFKMEIEQFIKNRLAISRFVEVLIRKAESDMETRIGLDTNIDVSIYEIANNQYSICVRKNRKQLVKLEMTTLDEQKKAAPKQK